MYKPDESAKASKTKFHSIKGFLKYAKDMEPSNLNSNHNLHYDQNSLSQIYVDTDPEEEFINESSLIKDDNTSMLKCGLKSNNMSANQTLGNWVI